MPDKQTFHFVMESKGDPSVGIFPCHERVTITFEYGGWDPDDVKEYFSKVLGDYCDGQARPA